jgi:putative inorganic carbon (hco3(-)) transporter
MSKRPNNLQSAGSLNFFLGLLFLATMVTMSAFLWLDLDVTILTVAFAAVALILYLISKPNVATMIVLFVIYTNIAVVLYQFHGLPQIVAGSVSLLFGVPFAVMIFVRKQIVIIDYPFLLMILFLGSLCLSSFFALDSGLSTSQIINFVFEGLILYFLIINVLRDAEIFRKVIWVLLIGAALLSSMSIYQQLTRHYGQQFGGLAQRNIDRWEDGVGDKKPERVQVSERAAGPIGGPNRYAQILLFMLPLAFFRIWDERKLKIFALLVFSLIFSGILLTYSRGAFLTLVLLILIMVVLRYIRPAQLIFLSVVFFLIIFAISPDYFNRMESIQGIKGLFSEQVDVQPDAVTRGRLTEMLAAFYVFLDHPVVGVGPGHFTPYYSLDYMTGPHALRQISSQRRAHTLYFEVMAETGIIGFSIFMSVVALILVRLWRIRLYWISKNSEYANIITALFLGVISYLGTAVFLHFSYQRFYWLFLALAGAAIQIFKPMHSKKTIPQKDTD